MNSASQHLDKACVGAVRYAKQHGLDSTAFKNLNAYENEHGSWSPALRVDFSNGASAYFDEFGACIGETS